MNTTAIRCCDDVKGKENESHSQLADIKYTCDNGCCDDVKGKENESHSQLQSPTSSAAMSCCDDVKGKDFCWNTTL